MPKLTKSAPKYRRHRASGQAFVVLNGRYFYLGKFGSKESRTHYDQLIGQWLASGRSPIFGIEKKSNDLTIGQLVDLYVKYAQTRYRSPTGNPTGEAEHQAPLLRRLSIHYGSTPATEFSPLAFKDFISRLVTDKLSLATVNRAIRVVKVMFRWATSEELIVHSVYERLRTVENEKLGSTNAIAPKVRNAVDLETVNRVLHHLPPMVADMVRLQAATGMRAGELVIMRRCDVVDLDELLLYTPSRHKTQRSGIVRKVPIIGEAADILRKYLTNRKPDEFCFSPLESVKATIAERSRRRKTRMSCGNKPKKNRRFRVGDHYTSISYVKAISRACTKAGVKFTSHQLRHALAEKLQAQLGIEAAAAVLGHTRIETTRLYAKGNETLAINAMKLLQQNEVATSGNQTT